MLKIHLVRLSPVYVRRKLASLAAEIEFVRLKQADIILSTLADRGTCTFLNVRRPLVLVCPGSSDMPFSIEQTTSGVPTYFCRIDFLEETIRHVMNVSARDE